MARRVPAGAFIVPIFVGSLLAVCFLPVVKSEAMETNRAIKGSSQPAANLNSTTRGEKRVELQASGDGAGIDSTLITEWPHATHRRLQTYSSTVAPRRSLWAHFSGCSAAPTVCLEKVNSLHGTICCANQCVDLTSDPHHCGHCGHICKWDRVCCKGKCKNLNDDNDNCGDCGLKCHPADGTCRFGICGY